MLPSLIIKNFRSLQNLRIDSLERVNLITGKNNTGKSSLLEAISVYAKRGDFSWIYRLLDERGETYKLKKSTRQFVESGQFARDNLSVFSSLFTDRKISFEPENAVFIGSLENTLFGHKESSAAYVSFRFVKYFEEPSKTENIEILPARMIRKILEESEADENLDFQIGVELRNDRFSWIYSLNNGFGLRQPGFKNISNLDNIQYIRPREIDGGSNSSLWDGITLTEKEKYVIDALKIIEPLVERIAFVSDEHSSGIRTSVVKLKNYADPIPLKSMGDGINRILSIVLALVNSDQGFLLIDELENGLHHSVQEQLWKIIFQLSKQLNVQVFATTHSNDCIRGFENVLNEEGNTIEGKLIRLENKNGQIRQVEFDAEELKTATEHAIEIR